MVPSSPDYFCVMAIKALTTVLPRWRAWSNEARELKILSEATYPFPKVSPKLLGTVIQNYRPRSGKPTRGFQKWIDEINSSVREHFVPKLVECDMTLPEATYKNHSVAPDYCLSTIPDFNTLIAKSQKFQTPVFALSTAQIGATGVVLTAQQRKKEEFKSLFSKMADTILGMTSNASSS